MAEGRETALRAALQVMHGREVDTPDILAIAEWLRSGKHPYDEQASSIGTIDANPDLRAELDQVKAVNRALNERARTFADSWHRIEQLVGREFTSPESVIDRIAYLAEEFERQLPSNVARLERQRDELLRGARRFVQADDSVSGKYALELADVVDKIEREDT
jgi:hypothetical protein